VVSLLLPPGARNDGWGGAGVGCPTGSPARAYGWQAPSRSPRRWSEAAAGARAEAVLRQRQPVVGRQAYASRAAWWRW